MSKKGRRLNRQRRAQNNGGAQITTITSAIRTSLHSVDCAPSPAAKTAGDPVTMGNKTAKSTARNSPFEVFTPAYLREFLKRFSELPGVEKGEIFHTYNGPLHTLLVDWEIKNGPILMALGQELGILRHWGRVWQFVNPTHFDVFVPSHWYERAKANYHNHVQCVAERRLALERVEQLEKVSAANPRAIAPDDQRGDEQLHLQVADMIADLEEARSGLFLAGKDLSVARAELAESRSKISDLEIRLEEKCRITSDDVAKYLAELRSRK